MASWKKVLVSGSSIEIAAVTSSATPTIGSIGSNYVVMIDPSTGYVSKITSGNFQASLGQYAYTASAVSGTPIVIGAADTLNISGSGGLTTTISTISGGARINVSANTGAGLSVSNNTITVDSGSMLAYYSSSIFSRISGDILVTSAGVATIQAGAVAISTDVSGLGVGVAGALSFAVGSAGSFVVNGGALGTPSSGTLTNATGLPISTGVSGLGTGVATALAVNIGTAGSVLINGGALGTPSSGTLTNATGLPIATGVSGLASGAATFLATPSSANLAALLTDETGTGANVFAGSPTFTGTANFASISTSGNVTIAGDLTVNGTTTTINTDNLLVEDRFALFASGSTTATDGGLVIQAATGAGTATGFALGYYATADRWAYQDALAFNASGFGTPTAYAVTAETAAGAPAANPAYGGATYGYGNIFVNSSNGDIFIYS